MRCTTCNKFVSYEDPHEIEVESEPEINDGEITATYRIVLKCAECNDELKDANIDVSFTPEGWEEHTGDGHEQEVDVDEPEADVKTEGKGRFLKTSYGFTAHYKATCSCGDSIEGDLSGYEQASAMNELQ